jgi:uncharacterized membrane protein YczE
MEETLRRLPRVVVGLVLFGVGIALMVAGDLGLGPWDVFHQGLSDLTGIGIGTIILIVGFAIVFLFIPLDEKVGLGTLLNAVLIGVTVDIVLIVLSTPDSMVMRWLLMLFGPVLIAIGSGLYIGGGLGPGPRDGVMTGLAKRGIRVSRARTGIEVTVLLAGIALGGGVGVGTIWFAFGIGPMVGWFLPRLAMSPPTATASPAPG